MSKASLPKIEDESVMSVAQATCYFARRLHQKLATAEQNVFFSPFSLSVAMSMLLRGSKETTAEEIIRALCFDTVNISTADIHNAFGKLISAISESKEAYILAVANAFACHKSFELKNEYKNDLQTIYKAESWEMDFSEGCQKAVTEINDWVKANTRGMIPNLLDSLDPSTVLILLNAVYFKGTWEHAFDRSRTRPKTFYNRGLDSMAKSVPMMTMKEHFLYMSAPSYKALEMSYKGDDIAMLILLPHEKNGIVDLEQNLGDDFLKSVKENLHNVEVTVTLPKLRMEYSKSMKTVFQDLGISAVFDHCRSNLEGVSEMGGLEVSEVIHKAVIDINEEGSEAAAVTAVMMMRCCLIVAPPIEFVADHPFILVIYSKQSGMIFFMGRVFEL